MIPEVAQVIFYDLSQVFQSLEVLDAVNCHLHLPKEARKSPVTEERTALFTILLDIDNANLVAAGDNLDNSIDGDL
jgi:hypothetical protein